MVKFNELHSLPAGVLDAPAQDLHRLMAPATLVHLPGREPRPLFVSVLVHGNEDAGLKAIQQVLRRAGGRPLPRALSIFFGNLEAAARNVRFLPSQPDFNRVWGESQPEGPYREMAQAVLRAMSSRQVFAAIDLHNNTGRNPLYSCISPGPHPSRQLASLFSHLAIQTGNIVGTLTSAFAAHCPSITCECGEIGNEQGARRAAELVERCLLMTPAQLAEVDDSRLSTFETFATIQVPREFTIDATGQARDADIQLSPEIDLLNFLELPAGYSLAKVRRNLRGEALLALDGNGERLPGVFVRHGDEIRLASASTPAMLTLQEDAIRKTCLGYLMRRTAPPAALSSAPTH